VRTVTPEPKGGGPILMKINMGESHGNMRVQRQNPYFSARPCPYFIVRESRSRYVVIHILDK